MRVGGWVHTEGRGAEGRACTAGLGRVWCVFVVGTQAHMGAPHGRRYSVVWCPVQSYAHPVGTPDDVQTALPPHFKIHAN